MLWFFVRAYDFFFFLNIFPPFHGLFHLYENCSYPQAKGLLKSEFRLLVLLKKKTIIRVYNIHIVLDGLDIVFAYFQPLFIMEPFPRQPGKNTGIYIVNSDHFPPSSFEIQFFLRQISLRRSGFIAQKDVFLRSFSPFLM